MTLPVRACFCGMLALTWGIALAGPVVRAAEPTAHEVLIEKLVPPPRSREPVRPPYRPARYDVGLPAPAAPGTSEINEYVKEQHQKLVSQAKARQAELGIEWRAVEKSFVQKAALTPDEQAARAFLEYAFGKDDPQPALEAARKAGPAARLRVARLLMAECRFELAVRELVELASSPAEARPVPFAPPTTREQALAILVTHEAERDALVKQGTQSFALPLAFDLHAFLVERARDPQDGPTIAALRKGVALRLPPEAVEASPALENEVIDIAIESASDGDLIFGGDRSFGLPGSQLDRTWLVTRTNEFVLYQEQEDHGKQLPIVGPEVTFKLHTIFHGAIQLRLYRFENRRTAEKIDAGKLAKLKPEREWQDVFNPLSHNNQGTLGGDTAEVKLEDLKPGHYLLTAQARYSPVLAGCQFSVSQVALYLRALRNQAVVVAVDRQNGKPRAGLPLELTIRGKPDLGSILKADQIFSEDSTALDQAFYGREPQGDLRPDDPRTVIARARAWKQGQELRRRHPDFHQVRKLVTDANGTAVVPLDLSRGTYSYELDAEHAPAGMDEIGLARASLEWHESLGDVWRATTVIWTAQPLHRPGDTVHFKGIQRRTNGEVVADAKPGEVKVAVLSGERSVWRGTCALSEFGTFEGSFRLPHSADAGDYRFEVDEHRTAPQAPLRVCEFRMPTFQVRFEPGSGLIRAGDKVSGAVRVEYFTGKPAGAAQVNVELLDLHTTQTLMADAQGRAAFEFPVAASPKARDYMLRATVSDVSGQVYTVYHRMLVERRAFLVEIQSVGAAVKDSESATEYSRPVAVRATTWSGEPIEGANVTLSDSDRSVATDKQGRARLAAPVDEDGSHAGFTVTVSWKGNAVESPIERPRPLRGDTGQEPNTLTRFRVTECALPHRIDAGEPLEVRFQLAGPVGQKAVVALFAENTRLLATKTLVVAPGEHRVTIPTATDWAPSLRVHLVAFDGSNAPLPCESACFLTPREKFLSLSIATDKSEYRPGEPCTAVITVVDHQGRAVPRAEISLGVIDAALYQLRKDPTPDLLSFFHEYHLPRTAKSEFDTRTGWWRDRSFLLGPQYAWGYFVDDGRLHSHRGGMALISRYGGAGGVDRDRLLRLREDFRTTAHWVANLVTDRDGKARATFPFPENLTSWAFTARGVTADTRVGEVRVERKTLLPLSIDVTLPRVVREGDELSIPVVLHNHGQKPRTVGGTTQTGAERPVEWAEQDLAPQGSARFDLKLPALGSQPVPLQVTVRDQKSPLTDGASRTLKPMPRGMPRTLTFAGNLAGEVIIDADLRGKMSEAGLVVEIRRESGFAGPVKTGVEGLIEYPYGCVEQTMSRFMPALVAHRALRAAKISNPAAERLPEVFEKSLARLQGFQHRDGGWGWWEKDPTNDFMTAYVLLGLAHCKQTDTPIPPFMVEHGQRRLLERLRGNELTGRGPSSIGQVDLPVYAAYALARLYATDPETWKQSAGELRTAIDDLDRRPVGKERSLLTRILDAHARHLLGDSAKARAELDALERDVDLTELNGQCIQEAAALLELGASLDAQDKRWRQLGTNLVDLRRGAGWGDTLTTSAAIRGLAALIESPPQTASPILIRVNGKEVGRIEPDNDRVRMTLPVAAKITLVAPADCTDRYTARVSGVLTEPPFTPPNAEIKLQVRLYPPPVRDAEGKADPDRPRAPLAVDERGRLRVPTRQNLELVCRVELTKDVEFARLSIPRPAGVELIPGGPGALGVKGIAGAEERDDAFHFFIDRWEAGVHELRILVQAELRGTVMAPWPELEPMYAPSMSTAVDAVTVWRLE